MTLLISECHSRRPDAALLYKATFACLQKKATIGSVLGDQCYNAMLMNAEHPFYRL
jgi:hypothetical protein